MKKLLLGIIVFLLIIGSVCFSIKNSINNKIEAKIEELNQNGFAVSYNPDSKIGKTLGKGEVEIVYPNRVISYLLSKVEKEETKKTLENFCNLLDNDAKEELLEGVTFEYNFVINNFSSNFDLDIYLTKLSQRTMYNLYNFGQNYAYQQNSWLQDLLKNRKIHLNINKDKNFKLDDISLTIPNSAFITLRGVEGTQDSLNISLIKIADTFNDSMSYGKFILSKLALKFDSQKEVENSKLVIENIKYRNYINIFNMKNLTLDSKTIKDKNNLSENNSISFDELNLKTDENHLYSQKNIKNIELNKTSLNMNIDKFPLQKYEAMMKSLYTMNSKKEIFDFIDEAIKNDLNLVINGQSFGLNVDDKNCFNNLKFNSNFKLNKNLSSSTDIPKTVLDIFQVIKATIDIDNESADKLQKTLLNNKEIKATDIGNNQKRFDVELKADGLYLNNEKLLEEKELNFSSLKNINKDKIGKVESSYKLIDKNTLQVTFKYNTNLKNLKGGGIAVSFPQFKDASKIKAFHTNSFDKIDYFTAGQDIYSGFLGKNVKGEYLMVEGWDNNWTDPTQEKEFSLDINIEELLKGDYGYLEINLRGGALDSEGNSELVPSKNENDTTDQQSYPVEVADIYLPDLVNSDLVPMEPLVTPPSEKK